MTAVSLPAALGLDDAPQPLVALTGGGGKSSLLFALGAALAARGQRVVLTTTTRLFAHQTERPDALRLDDFDDVAANPTLTHILDRLGTCLLTGPQVGDKVQGVAADVPGQLLARPDVDAVVVEADGSRQLPIKAPAAHEPVVPPDASLVVVVVGVDALQRPWRETIHRIPQFRKLLPPELDLDDVAVLTSEMAAAVLRHPEGGLKGAPATARLAVWINKVEDEVQQSLAARLARLLLAESRIERVLIGAAQAAKPVKMVAQRVTAVILAAGEGRRMGRTKQLLPWGETTVLGQTLANVQASLATHVLVVTGHEAAAVAVIAQEAGAETVHNPDYATGEMVSSLQAALGVLDHAETAVVVVLADQPLVGPDVIDRLIRAYWAGAGGLVAPTFNGRRGNPVLIGRRYFAELLALAPTQPPRTLLRRHADDVALVAVDSAAIHLDLDEPEQYARHRPGGVAG